MKPFDIELAKQGYPVCTRDGRDVKILCFDHYEKFDCDCPIIARVYEYETYNNVDKILCDYIVKYRKNGREAHYKEEQPADLFMKSECWCWCNPYDKTEFLVNRYATKEEAEQHPIEEEGYVLAKLEWED